MVKRLINTDLDRAILVVQEAQEHTKPLLIKQLIKAFANEGDSTSALKWAQMIVGEGDPQQIVIIALGAALNKHTKNRDIDGAIQVMQTLPSLSTPQALSLKKLAEFESYNGSRANALKIALMLPHQEIQCDILHAIVCAMIHRKKFQKAIDTAKLISLPKIQSKAFQAIVHRLIKKRRLDEALDVAQMISDTKKKSRALTHIVKALRKNDQPEKAEEVSRLIPTQLAKSKRKK
jgi:hypothetical protein